MPRARFIIGPSHETSPLIQPQIHDGDRDLEDIHHLPALLELDEPEIKTRSSLYLFLLSLSILGLQVVWSVELSHGSPYLLSLGVSKSLLAFVWIAGPLSGFLVQPYVGIRSDNCRISWGKRKPFMIGGGIASVTGLICLAWAKEIAAGFLSIFGVEAESTGSKSLAVFLAVISLYVLDFSLNTVSAAIRCFIVDNAPVHQQETANAWASRVSGLGNVVGYLFGYVDLTKYLSFLGNTQFKVLCVISSLSLSLTLFISCWYIKERDPRLDGPPVANDFGVMGFFRQVYGAAKRLPPQIRIVCQIQLWAWIGWFPFLFYITTYVGQLYVNPYLHPGMSDSDIRDLWEQATRVGTFALLLYAIATFLWNTFLPFFVVPTYQPPRQQGRMAVTPTSPIGVRSRVSSYGHLPLSASTTSFSTYLSREERQSMARSSSLFSRLQIPGLTLRRTWFISHLIFACCMFSTFFVQTPFASTVLTATMGLPWAVTCWAPFALISSEIAKRDEARRQYLRRTSQAILSRSSAVDFASIAEGDAKGVEDGPADQAGVILGLHNVAICTPQVVATLMSSAVFRALQKPRDEPGDDSVGWVLRIGGFAALLAAYWTMKLHEDTGDD